MSASETNYTAHVRIPHLIERGRTQLIQCPTFLDGAASAPSSGTVSVYRPTEGPDDTPVIDAQAVTITSSVAEYSVTFGSSANQIPTTEALGAGWRVEWALTMADGIVHTFRFDGALVRRRLYPVVTDQDMERAHPGIDALLPSGQTHWQNQVDEAWWDIQRRLIAAGNRPNLVMEPTALYDAHLSRSLYRVFRLLKTRMTVDSQYAALAEEYSADYESAWDALRFRYDADDLGRIDESQPKRGAQPQVWLGKLRRGGSW